MVINGKHGLFSVLEHIESKKTFITQMSFSFFVFNVWEKKNPNSGKMELEKWIKEVKAFLFV